MPMHPRDVSEKKKPNKKIIKKQRKLIIESSILLFVSRSINNNNNKKKKKKEKEVSKQKSLLNFPSSMIARWIYYWLDTVWYGQSIDHLMMHIDMNTSQKLNSIGII